MRRPGPLPPLTREDEPAVRRALRILGSVCRIPKPNVASLQFLVTEGHVQGEDE